MNMRDLMPWSRPRTPSTRRAGTPSLFDFQDEMNRRFEEMMRAFDEPMGQMTRGFGRNMPSVDVREDDKNVRVAAELPGMEEKDVEVTFADGVLRLRGEKRAEREEKNERYHVMERSYGTFERAIPVGPDIDEDKISAEFKNGVLTVTLPKAPEAQRQAKRIAINTGSNDGEQEQTTEQQPS